MSDARGRRVFVRGLSALALFTALVTTRLVSAQIGSTPAFTAVGPFASPRIAALQRAVEEKDPEAVERFWAAVRASDAPLVEPAPGSQQSSLVTFVYRGTSATRNVVVVDGVAVAVGGVDPRNSQMTQLAGTDVWYRTYQVRNDARFVYKLSENDSLQSFVDPNRKSDSKVDPLNPRVFPTGQSYLALPAAPPQHALQASDLRGTVERTTFPSARLGNDRSVWIYTPPGFRDGGGPYPLLVVLDGGAYTTLVPVPVILDNLIAQGRLAATVAVMVGAPAGQRGPEQTCSSRFSDFLVNELVTSMRTNYRVSSDPRLTAIAGSSLGGLAASCAAFRHPDVFGKVLSQSGSYWWTPDSKTGAEFLTGEFARSPRLPLQFFIEVGEMEIPDQLDTNRRLRDVLKSKDYAVDYREFNGNHTYLCWRGSFGDGLISLIGGAADGTQGAR
jgi:enterochelin esterase family protein